MTDFRVEKAVGCFLFEETLDATESEDVRVWAVAGDRVEFQQNRVLLALRDGEDGFEVCLGVRAKEKRLDQVLGQPVASCVAEKQKNVVSRLHEAVERRGETALGHDEAVEAKVVCSVSENETDSFRQLKQVVENDNVEFSEKGRRITKVFQRKRHHF